MNEIYNLLSMYNENKEVVILEFLERFKPLFHKYSRNSGYSDMESELILFFIELIPKIPIDKEIFKEDKYIVSYIQKSLKNQYIYLNKQYVSTLKTDNQLSCLDYYSPEIDESFSNIELENLLEMLTTKERKVIICKYKYDLSFVNIGKITKTSRQSVYNTHKRAIKKLKNILSVK